MWNLALKIQTFLLSEKGFIENNLNIFTKFEKFLRVINSSKRVEKFHKCYHT